MWNTLDANATLVGVELHRDWDAITQIVVTDNGHDMTPERARAAFKGYGETVRPTSMQRPLHGKRPRESRFPRSERFCWGRLGGAGGTRTYSGDASHLRFSWRSGHINLFPSGCVPLDPTPADAVQRSLHASAATRNR
ncbi:ATP-binding protein [Streptomyces durmitorensis]|uniref:ATP-binding protein n=2 Tax=Streptomyces durmitorensis TaxID=319947 RepID=A0ABY4PNI1_9ACTN|nr:ATP-binding protein [Streptomyces durmitorensis]